MRLLKIVFFVAILLGVGIFVFRFLAAPSKKNLAVVASPAETTPLMPSPRAAVFDQGSGAAPVAPEAGPRPVAAVNPENTSVPEPTVNEQKPKNEFALRKLDLPMPGSVQDLLSHLGAFDIPRLPVSGLGDGDVTTEFRGYYKAGANYLRMVLERYSFGEMKQIFVLTLEKPDHSFEHHESKEGALQLRNFNGDPYSVVMKLPDGKIIYLKYLSRYSIVGKDREARTVRAMNGWLLSSGSLASDIFPVAILDVDSGWNAGAGPDADKTQAEMPPPSLLAPLFPQKLPSRGVETK